MVMVNVLNEKMLIFVRQDAKQQKLFLMNDKGCTIFLLLTLTPEVLRLKAALFIKK